MLNDTIEYLGYNANCSIVLTKCGDLNTLLFNNTTLLYFGNIEVCSSVFSSDNKFNIPPQSHPHCLHNKLN